MGYIEFEILEDRWGERWAGIYRITEITGFDLMEINVEVSKKAREEGSLVGEFDMGLWNNLLIERSATLTPKDKPTITLPISDDMLKEMPAKLYNILLVAAQRLNTLSEEERIFLRIRSS